MPVTSLADRRAALLDQLAYLNDEIEALRQIVKVVPEPLLSGRPLPEDLSIKELYGWIAQQDAEVHQPRLERLLAEDTPQVTEADQAAMLAERDWNAKPIGDLLTAVQSARTAFIDFLKAIPEADWTRTLDLDEHRYDVYAYLFEVIQANTADLRTLGYRLHGSLGQARR
ncbi:MAG: DinB family protein [Rhodothermales bacterium]